MTISGISTNVQALLEATTKFVTVLPAPPEEDNNFEGYPAASHYYADTDNQYATVSQNRRTIEYRVELYIVPDKATSLQELLTLEAYPLIDSIIDMFDQSIDLSSTTLGLSRACDIMRPAPGTLERVETDQGLGVMMTLRLFCEGDITFTSN